ncbi:MAG: universal stress protein [Gillisia sp.]
MKKVLIAVDYSPSSEKITEAGYKLSKDMQASVCIMHVITDIKYYGMEYPAFMGYTGYNMDIDLTMEDEVQNVAEGFLEKTKEHFKDPELSTHIGRGDTADTILNYASEWNADVLVIGTHSRSALEKFFIGDVASEILKSATIPLYIIPIREEKEKK